MPAKAEATAVRSTPTCRSVAIAGNVSTLLGLVAVSVPDGARVLAPEVEFTSVLFPFMAQERRGVSVRLVPAAELAGEIGADVDVVAFSAVQMATGEVADLEGIARAAREHDVMTVVDATAALGFWILKPEGTLCLRMQC